MKEKQGEQKNSKLKALAGISSIIVGASLYIAVLPLIFALAYLVGHEYLEGNTLWGNDSFSYFSVVNWFSQYFPKLPFWFPLQGGGVSFLAGYPWGGAIIVILVDRLTHYDLVQSFRLVGWLSVPITAVGIVAVAWTRLTDIKPSWVRVILGGIAGLFYVASPMAWIWLVRWGFYAENVSHMFVPWAILFFDVLIERLIQKKHDLVFRIALLGAVVFWLLGTLVHFFAGYSLIAIFAVLSLIHFILAKENRIAVAKRIVFPLVLIGMSFAGIFAFRLVPYQMYMKNVAVGGFTGYAAPGTATYLETARNMLTTKIMLSLQEIEETSMNEIDIYRRTIKDMIFPFYVWVLILPTLAVSWIKSKKIFFLALYTVVGFIVNTNIELYMYLTSHLGPLNLLLGFLSGRVFFIPMRIIIPILAAYGAYIIWEVIGWALLYFPKKFKPVYYTLYPIKVVAVVVLTIATAGFVTFKYYNLPYSRYQLNVGAFPHKPDLRDIWMRTPLDERNVKIMTKEAFNENPDYDLVLKQLERSNWPAFTISNDIENELKGTRIAFDQLPQNTTYRFDMSGFAGRQVMISPLVSKNSQIQVYINTLSLIYNSWNYQGQVMYTTYPLYQKPGTLTELGKWFGLNYVFLAGSGLEPFDYWKTDSNWESVTANWRHFKNPISTVSWDTRQKVLLVSDNKKFFYDQTFKYLTQGGLLYEQAIPVRGEKEVDKYTLEELKHYDAIFMRGYGYKSKSGAYKLLDNYIRQGGTVIFDTGWQWLVPDYELTKAPEFMPFESLKWKSLDTKGNWVNANADIAKDIDINKLGSLTWENTSWGVSTPGKLRSWAKPILKYDDEPLVIGGEYGKGRVVWIGFNIIPHAEAKDAPEEIKLLNRLFEWGLKGYGSHQEFSVDFDQTNPDKVILTLNEDKEERSHIYFRQSYHPNWHAYLSTNKVKHQIEVLRAGPGFMLMELPKLHKGDKLVLLIKKPPVQIFSEFISILTLMILILYTFVPGVFRYLTSKIQVRKVRIPGKINMKGNLKKFATSTIGDEETENY